MLQMELLVPVGSKIFRGDEERVVIAIKIQNNHKIPQFFWETKQKVILTLSQNLLCLFLCGAQIAEHYAGFSNTVTPELNLLCLLMVRLCSIFMSVATDVLTRSISHRQ